MDEPGDGPVPRDSGTTGERPHDPDSPRRRSSSAGWVAEQIVARIDDGTWAGDKYPTIHQIKDTLRCSLRIASDATKILAAEGVIHKVKLPRPPGQRGRLLVWRPVDVSSDGPEEIARQVEDDIRSGRLAGELPMIGELAQSMHVAHKVISEVYHRLRDEDLVGQVWVKDLSYRVWYAFHGPDDPARRRTGESKSLAIAHDLIQRIPEWLVQRPRGGWCRTPLPDMESLRIHYGTHFFSIEAALDLLVRLRILEQPLGNNRTYLPCPPDDDGASHNVTFTRTAAPLGRDWFPVTTSARWLPLGLTREDETLASMPDRAAVARGQYLQNREQRMKLLRQRGLL